MNNPPYPSRLVGRRVVLTAPDHVTLKRYEVGAVLVVEWRTGALGFYVTPPGGPALFVAWSEVEELAPAEDAP